MKRKCTIFVSVVILLISYLNFQQTARNKQLANDIHMEVQEINATLEAVKATCQTGGKDK